MLVGYYHPGLRRLADYQNLYPLAKIRSEAEVWYQLLKLGFTAAHLEIPACAHIGWEQRTMSHTFKSNKMVNKVKKYSMKMRLSKMAILFHLRRLLSAFRSCEKREDSSK